MTATTAFDRQIARAHGLDRAVMRLSLATLRWANARAERAARKLTVSRDEHVRSLELQAATQRREHESALRAARVL